MSSGLHRVLVSALVIFVWSTTTPLHAQDFFELRFTDKNNVSYKGLLEIFNEKEMYMRVGYKVEGVYKVVKCSYTSQDGKNKDGSEYLVLSGSNPESITNPGGKAGYDPDNLIFLQNSDLPYVTSGEDLVGNMVKADKFKALTAEELTDTYLRQFYLQNEPEYLMLRKMIGLDKGASVVHDNSAITLHLIIVANTLDGSIGGSCQIDQRSLYSEFSGITQALGIHFKSYTLNGEDFTKANVKSLLSRITPASDDIVVFVYRGHGFRWSDQSIAWPRLDLRYSPYMRIEEQSSMGLDEIYQSVVAKKARLNIILGDCCNSNVGISQITSNSFLSMQGNNNYNLAKLQTLFINSHGNLLATAASPGEVSWANNANGGFFTVSFLQSLREEISYLRSDEADWKGLIGNTINGARNKSGKGTCANCTTQNGMKYCDITND